MALYNHNEPIGTSIRIKSRKRATQFVRAAPSFIIEENRTPRRGGTVDTSYCNAAAYDASRKTQAVDDKVKPPAIAALHGGKPACSSLPDN